MIVGAGLSGLATALSLHQKGIKSLILELSDTLRASGFAFMTWTNEWRAMDPLGVADSLQRHHPCIQRVITSSASSGAIASQVSLTAEGKCGEHEGRCVRRNLLLETLAKELLEGTIRYSSKVVSIDEDGVLKLLHMADGSILKAKVVVGCDGVNSSVTRYLGLKKSSFFGCSLPEEQNGKTSFLFTPGDLDNCVSKIERLLSSEEFREAMVKAVRQEREKYDWKAATRNIRNEQFNAAIWF